MSISLRQNVSFDLRYKGRAKRVNQRDSNGDDSGRTRETDQWQNHVYELLM